jgi:HlyD family secretion protein
LGAGKSTLARAITGVWRPPGDEIRLDGASLDNYEPDILGYHIGYLPLRVQLFDETIADNIARLDPDADAEKIVVATKKAAEHDMILKLPEGYDIVVTTTVGRISGGQIQRIGLADHQKLFDRGLAQASRVLALQRTQAELSGNLGDLVAREADAAGRITEIEIEIQSQFTRRQEEVITRLRDQQFRALELGERTQALLDRLERMDIRAPASSIVYGLTVFTPRSVIRAAEPVMYLIPQDHPLIIAAQVSPINIEELFVSKDVTYAFQH